MWVTEDDCLSFERMSLRQSRSVCNYAGTSSWRNNSRKILDHDHGNHIREYPPCSTRTTSSEAQLLNDPFLTLQLDVSWFPARYRVFGTGWPAWLASATGNVRVGVPIALKEWTNGGTERGCRCAAPASWDPLTIWRGVDNSFWHLGTKVKSCVPQSSGSEGEGKAQSSNLIEIHKLIRNEEKLRRRLELWEEEALLQRKVKVTVGVRVLGDCNRTNHHWLTGHAVSWYCPIPTRSFAMLNAQFRKVTGQHTAIIVAEDKHANLLPVSHNDGIPPIGTSGRTALSGISAKPRAVMYPTFHLTAVIYRTAKGLGIPSAEIVHSLGS